MTARAEEPAGAMTFFEHLSELRKRIIYSLYAIGIGAFIGVYVSKYIINFIIRPIIKALTEAHLTDELVYTHPAGYLNTTLRSGGILESFLLSPFVLTRFCFSFGRPGSITTRAPC